MLTTISVSFTFFDPLGTPFQAKMRCNLPQFGPIFEPSGTLIENTNNLSLYIY